LSEQPDTTPTEDDPFAETQADPFADSSTAEAPPQEPPPEPSPPQPEPPAPEPTPEPTPEPQPDAPAEPTPEPSPDIPQVDREGQPVSSGPLATTEEDASAAAPEEPPAEQPADQMAPVEAVEQPQAPAEAPPQPETPAAPEPQQQAPPAAPDQAPSNGTQAESNSDGPKSIRHYKLLYATGPTSFEVAPLTDGDGKAKEEYVKLIEGEHYLEARNNEHAYKLAFHLMGAPREGVTLWPVPKASYRPRKVSPAPPAPERERLVIS
jgi:hypothetical protein